MARMSHNPSKLLFAATAFLVVSLAAAAQAPETFNLSAVDVHGLARYTNYEVVRGSGLHIGSPIAVVDLQNSVAVLAKSGAFDSVSYRYTTHGKDLVAQFDVVETKNTLSPIFDNFVWFSDADLDKAIRARVSFYDGKLPERGDTTDRARAALQDLLRERGLPGEVQHIADISAGGTVTGILFRVDGVAEPIKSISFTGEAHVTAAQLAEATNGLVGQNFSVTNVAVYARDGLLPIYHQRGYLRSEFGAPKVALVDPAAKGPTFDVTITLSVTEGDQYSLSSINFSGNQAISSSELGKAFAVAPHQVANSQLLDDGFHNANKLYQSRGYIKAQVIPQLELDDAAKLAAYAVKVNEGNQYRMGQVKFEGVDERVASILSQKWKLKPGDVYDGNYYNEFMSKIALPELARAGVKVSKPTVKQNPDPASLKVDLNIQFH